MPSTDHAFSHRDCYYYDLYSALRTRPHCAETGRPNLATLNLGDRRHSTVILRLSQIRRLGSAFGRQLELSLVHWPMRMSRYEEAMRRLQPTEGGLKIMRKANDALSVTTLVALTKIPAPSAPTDSVRDRITLNVCVLPVCAIAERHACTCQPI